MTPRPAEGGNPRPDPAFFEHKFLYRRNQEELGRRILVPIGKAAFAAKADISYHVWRHGLCRTRCRRELEKEAIDVEVLDLRSLLPFDGKPCWNP
jgi:pyruvate dehydrogenase E1 component beta subunit